MVTFQIASSFTEVIVRFDFCDCTYCVVDGVGEGQLAAVMANELEQIKLASEGIAKTKGKPPPEVAYVIVQKRTTGRFFAEGKYQVVSSGCY